MNQYNLLSPNNKDVLFDKSPKSAAIRAFKKYNKNENQTRISIQDNSTKKKYNYIVFKKSIINDFESQLNNNQIGGNNEDSVFYTKINELSSNINLSVNELVKILKTKYDPNNELLHHDKVFTMLDEGLKKIEMIDTSVKNINKNLGVAKDVVDPSIDTAHLTKPTIPNPGDQNKLIKVDESSDDDPDVDNAETKGAGKSINNNNEDFEQKGCLIM